MKRFWLGCLSIAFVCSVGLTERALSGANEGGVLLLHTDNDLVYTGDISDYSGMSGNPCNVSLTCPRPDDTCVCEFMNSELTVTSTKPLGEAAAVVWILAAFPPSGDEDEIPDPVCPDVKAVQFGFPEYDTDNILISDWGNIGDLEIPTSSPAWPQPFSGNAITFTNAQTRKVVEVYWLAIYAYYQDTLTLGINPPQGRASFGDSSIPAEQDDVVAFGTIGFGGETGTAPMFPGCGPIPTLDTTWGSVKGQYRGH